MSEAILRLIIILPFLGAFIIGIFGFISPSFRKQEKLIGSIGTLMVFIPFILILLTFFNYHEEVVRFSLFSWMEAGGLNISFDYRLDQLSLTMGMIVTGIGSLIHLYSIGYMHHDRGFYKFYLYLNLFIFAMLNLVLGNNLVVLFLGWEGVGACSYFLIGFWYEDMAKAKAAQKAFVANRIGDFAMICAMFLIYVNTGSLSFDTITDFNAYSGGEEAVTWICLLIFIAATGKSAQIPLYVWLPDAMAGPTPVSALIHAATMVTSGIYLIARMGAVFSHAEGVLVVVCLVASLTALMAALIAVAQNDIKKVLAYSTVSQLGFMFMALGAGAYTTAIFHVMTHAFFKACLFLGSGSVIHAMEHMHTVDDPQDVRTMGGLKKYMPATNITFFISTLAIAGIPLLSGFFSKDEILSRVFANGFENSIYFLFWFVGIGTAFLTAFYMTRVYFLTFRGKERFPDTKHPHESSPLMTIPLYILAFFAAVGGFFGIMPVVGHLFHIDHFLNHWLEGAVSMERVEDMERAMESALGGHGSFVMMEAFLIILSIAIAIGGVLLSWNFYKKHAVEGDTILRKKLGNMYTWMENKFYVDEFYQKVFIDPFVYVGKNIIMPFDKYVIDGFVNGVGSATSFFAGIFRRMQTGIVTNYALVVVIGVIVIMSYLILW